MPPRAYVAFRAASAAARVLPERSLPSVSAAAARIAVRSMGDSRALVARHQQRVRPDLQGAELESAVTAVFQHYVEYWLESFRLPDLSAPELDRRFSHEGYERIKAAIDAETGAILAMPHLGGWEFAAFWLTEVKGHQLTAVVEPVQPPELAEWFVDLRRKFGIHVVPLGPDAGTAVARAIKNNHVVALLSDRDVAGGGSPVTFFGEETTLPSGAATLALRTGAPVFPTAVYVQPSGHHHGVVRPPLDLTRTGRMRVDAQRVTQELAVELEVLIRQDPEQWHLLQPNWPSDREPAP